MIKSRIIKSNKISTEKKVYKTFLIISPIIFLIVFLFELILKSFKFIYTISYLIGALTSALCFYLSIKSVNSVDPYDKKGTKTRVIGFYFLKLILYGVVAILVYLYIYKHTIFTCFLGFFTIRIAIHIRYNLIDPYLNKHSKIEKLNVSDEIKLKLKQHNINKFIDLTNSHKNDLLFFLTKLEYKKLNKALFEYELFVKGELEVIRENENSNASTKH